MGTDQKYENGNTTHNALLVQFVYFPKVELPNFTYVCLLLKFGLIGHWKHVFEELKEWGSLQFDYKSFDDGWCELL